MKTNLATSYNRLPSWVCRVFYSCLTVKDEGKKSQKSAPRLLHMGLSNSAESKKEKKKKEKERNWI